MALLYALERPEQVDRIVYVSGTGIDSDRPWHETYTCALHDKLGTHRRRWEDLRMRDRTDQEDRELCLLQWSVDFADQENASEYADEMATPWFGVNFECNAALNAEMTDLWASADLEGRCRAKRVPTLILDGTEDIRPRWSVDSFEQALPHVRRVAFEGAGHLPWIEDPNGFKAAIVNFLAA